MVTRSVLLTEFHLLIRFYALANTLFTIEQKTLLDSQVLRKCIILVCF